MPKKKTTKKTSKIISPVLNKRKISAIIRSFENWGKSKDIPFRYKNWYCGISKYNDNTRQLQRQYKKEIKTMYFKILDAGTFENAHEIEIRLSEKGMRNKKHSGGANKSLSKYVYVYKENINILDKIVNFLDNL